MAWIRTVPPGEAEGELAREYATAEKRAGRVFKILELQSQNPRTLHDGIRFYLTVMHGQSGLTRIHRELLATVVSSINSCHY